MAITAADVKKLREMTGAGMMACKSALSETGGNIEEAVDFLRKKGLAAAQKKQSRVAAEGAVATFVEGSSAVVVEVNCETDFVSKGDDFQGFAKNVANFILSEKPSDIDALKTAKAEESNELTLKCGEKIDIRRFNTVNLDGAGVIGSYNHGGRIGVLVEVATSENIAGNEVVQGLAKDLSMHVAAAAPKFLTADDIDEDFKKREAEVYAGQLKEQGKPEQMIPKIVEGKLAKLASEVCLMNQKFIKDPDFTVGKLVESKAKELGGEISVKSFYLVNLGEGIEKKEDNLAEEVAKMTGK